MFKVTYCYFSYPRLERVFKKESSARWFFNRLAKDWRVTSARIEAVR